MNETTLWYECTKCGLPCQAMEQPPQGDRTIANPLSLCCRAAVIVRSPGPIQSQKKQDEKEG